MPDIKKILNIVQIGWKSKLKLYLDSIFGEKSSLNPFGRNKLTPAIPTKSREDDSAEKSNFYTLAIFAEVRDLKLLKRNKKDYLFKNSYWSR